MVGHREGVERAQALQSPPALGEQADVTGQRGRVAGYVAVPFAPVSRSREVIDDLARQPGAWRVGDGHPGRGEPAAAQHRRHVTPVYPRPGPLPQVVPRIPDGDRVRLDADHGAAWPD